MDKLLPSLRLQLAKSHTDAVNLYTVSVDDLKQFETVLVKNKSIKLISVYQPANIAVVECKWSELEKIISDPSIRSADVRKQPKEELLFGFVDYAVNRISTIQHRYPLFNANGIHLSVKEQKFDTTDIDLKGRILPSSFASTTGSNHASIMATMMAGGSNTWYNTKGASWGANLSSANFQNLLPEPDSYYNGSSVLLQNHSYGTVVESYYGAEAAGYDASVINNPSLLHIFSAGNSGSQAAPTGTYINLSGYSNLTGNFKHAKNIITVGHIDSFGTVLIPSSKGPAFDGRVKPELVAFGEDGSSGAAALVSGISGVLHHIYKQQHNNSSAPASLIKAVLLNSADDIETKGIDFKSGYGSVNGLHSVETISNGQFFVGSVTANTQQQFTIAIPANIKQLKLTLVWTDPQAAPNTSKALINDLDLELTHSASNTSWLPWVLNSSPSIVALQQLPTRKRDSLNVVEQITVDNPASGDYTVTVRGYSISAGSQSYSLAYQMDTVDTFSWHFPTSSDHLFPNQANVLRFQSNFSNTTGYLELSTDNGTSWQPISSSVDLTKGYYKLITPNSITKALLRLSVASKTFTSDTFTISQRLATSVGFNCPDSFLIAWPPVTGATGYRISKLGEKYMEPLLVTADTFVVLSKQLNPSLHYSVTPLLSGKAAVRSYTFNYEQQGSACYTRSFIADLTQDNKGALSLLLSTTYNVRSISFEKYLATGFSLLATQPSTNTTQYQFTDQKLIAGTNLYRAVIELSDGRKIVSDTASLFFTANKAAIIYPNPALVNGSLTILTEQDDDVIFQIIDNYGRIVLQKQITDYPEQVSLPGLQKGIHYYRLLKKNKKVQTGILIIQ
ncbi:S8 family peptidase [Lacibacter sp. H375]|uniref:S8 family peptidase n=1 Tax=Lacibacter sp. H375 TaxID=3133424 RepID=UPI0030C4D30F